MIRTTKPLADLHLHLYGSIHSLDYLGFVKNRVVDWTAYESAFQEAYGESPQIRKILEQCKLGSPGAQEEFQRLFVFGDKDAGNFARFQAKYNLLVKGSSWADFSQEDSAFGARVNEVCSFIRKIIARQRQQNVGYAEQRMTLSRELTPTQAKELLEAMLSTYSEYEGSDIQPRLAVSLPRDNPWPQWEVTRDVALGSFGHLLTGIDFCYLEEGYPPKQQRELFAEVADFNYRHPERALAILYHVGESFNDKSLESAVRWVHEAAEMGAHRLGHAIALGVNPEKYGVHRRSEPVAERIDQLNYDLRHIEGLEQCGVQVDAQGVRRELRQLCELPTDNILSIDYDARRLAELRGRQRYATQCIRDLGSVIEVCPTSNRRIGGISNPEHHPLVQFVANDAPFVVGSDDPGIFDTTLAKEIESAIAIAGLPADSYDEIAERAWFNRSEVLVGRLQ
jgi:adenosine deaminase